MGRVEDGTTTTDFDPDEIKRQISISAAMAPVEWKDCKLNLIDTPGYFDFVGEVISSMRVTESALVNICAVSWVEVGTEKVWKLAEDNKLPRICFVNKMDRKRQFRKVLNQARDMFGATSSPCRFPLAVKTISRAW